MAGEQAPIRDLTGGGNQSGLRDQNARLVMSYIRRHGGMASAEIARRSGLSAQTVSNIVRALEADGLLKKGAAVKGRVGKPSVPMALNSDGVYAFGLNIGRRSLELVLVDFLGTQIDAAILRYDYPAIQDVFDFVDQNVPNILQSTGVPRDRIAGFGVARPNRIWDWLDFVNAPGQAMSAWRDLDLAAEFSARTGFDIVEENDATSAVVAENLLGRGPEYHDFAYIFVGAFVGGGLVLDGKVLSGRTHNTAALGPLPVPDGNGGTVQLLNVASIHVLENALNTDIIWDVTDPHVSAWIGKTSDNLALACAAIASVVEVEAILLDGAFPEDVRREMTHRLHATFSQLDLTGIEKPKIEEARTGRRARSIGAALLPINSKYFFT